LVFGASLFFGFSIGGEDPLQRGVEDPLFRKYEKRKMG
jgi:hypothetical protein